MKEENDDEEEEEEEEDDDDNDPMMNRDMDRDGEKVFGDRNVAAGGGEGEGGGGGGVKARAGSESGDQQQSLNKFRRVSAHPHADEIIWLLLQQRRMIHVPALSYVLLVPYMFCIIHARDGIHLAA